VKRSVHILVLLAFAALLTQGFQCASSDVSAAKKALQAQDFAKAKQSLEKALTTNPNDCEALVLLGDANRGLNDADGMVTAYKKAMECPGVTPKQRDEMSVKLFNAWVGQYNGGINKFNDYVGSQKESDLSESAAMLEAAEQLKPAFSEPLALLGQIREMQNDTNASYAVYTRWWNIEKPGFETIINKNMTLGMPRGSFLKSLGTPLETKIDSLSGGGQLYKDRFDVGGRPLILFSALEGANPDALLEGWTYNPPDNIAEPEKWRTRSASLTPLKGMAFIDYQRGRRESAFQLATVVTKVKPTDPDLVPLRTQLLQDLGKTGEAMAEIEGRVKADPKNTLLRVQYASLLSASGKQDAAVKEYQDVLGQDPNNETALYNLAAHYKNIAGTKQRTELDKMDKDKNYKPDVSYMDDLATAAQYFEKLRRSPKYTADIIVLEQLANIYEVRKENGKVKALIMELEGLEEINKKNKEYYRIMEGLYGRNKMLDKMKEAQEKGEKL